MQLLETEVVFQEVVVSSVAYGIKQLLGQMFYTISGICLNQRDTDIQVAPGIRDTHFPMYLLGLEIQSDTNSCWDKSYKVSQVVSGNRDET